MGSGANSGTTPTLAETLGATWRTTLTPTSIFPRASKFQQTNGTKSVTKCLDGSSLQRQPRTGSTWPATTFATCTWVSTQLTLSTRPILCQEGHRRIIEGISTSSMMPSPNGSTSPRARSTTCSQSMRSDGTRITSSWASRSCRLT